MLASRAFPGRRRTDVDLSRVPPGQYVTDGFPVLSAGPTPLNELVFIGVHARFDLEHDLDNAHRATTDLRTDYPVASDNPDDQLPPGDSLRSDTLGANRLEEIG